MAAQGPIQQVLSVFETIDAHFKAHPELLNTDGIFRISSGGTKHIQLAEAIQTGNKLTEKDWQQYTAHDCANALKYVLLQNRLIGDSDPRISALRDAILKGDESDHLNRFIESLHGNEDELQIARILNIALDICRRASLQQKYNKMTPYNLAVVWGPCFQHCLNLEPKEADLNVEIAFMTRINPVVQTGIESGLIKVVPEIVAQRKRTLLEATQMYEGSRTLLSIAGENMGKIKQQQIEFERILKIKTALLKKGKLTSKEKKLMIAEVKEYKDKIAELEVKLRQWKPEAQRHLNYVAKFEEHSKILQGSFDRFDAMLSKVSTGTSASTSTSDDDHSVDHLLDNPPVVLTQFAQQQQDEGSEPQADLSASSSYDSDLDNESSSTPKRAAL